MTNSLALSADGKLAVCADLDGTLSVWRLAGNTPLLTMRHDGVCSVFISPDGRLAVSGGKDQTAKLWDLSSGECLRVFQTQMQQIAAVCLSRDARQVICGADRGLEAWDISSGRSLYRVPTSRELTSISVSSEGHVLTGAIDNVVRLYELSSGSQLRFFEGHGLGAIRTVAISAGGRLAVSAGDDQDVRVWDVQSGRCRKVLAGHTAAIASVCLSVDEQQALSGDLEGTSKLWELSGGTCLRSLKRDSPVFSLSLSENTQIAILGPHEERPFEVWSLKSGGALQAPPQWPSLPVETAAEIFSQAGTFTRGSLSADGQNVITIDTSLREWSVVTGSCSKVVALTDIPTECAISADGRFAASGGSRPQSQHSCVEVFDLKTMQVTDFDVPSLVFSPPPLKGSLNSLCLSADGSRVLVAGRDTSVRLYEVADGQSKTLQECDLQWTLCFTEDGTQAYSVGREILHWDLERGRRVASRPLEGQFWPGELFRTAPGIVLVSPERKGDFKGSRVRLWDVINHRSLGVIDHGSIQSCASISCDGRHALSGGQDGTLKIWDIANGKCLQTLEGPSSWVLSASLAADKGSILAVFPDQFRVWKLDPRLV